MYLNKITIIILFVLFNFVLNSNISAQEVINSGDISVTITKLAKGAELSSIKKGDTELLDTDVQKTFFTLMVSGNFLTSLSSWGNVVINNDGTNCKVVLSKSSIASLPATLTVTVTIGASENGVDMDLNVKGLGSFTLTEAHFPYLNIKADGNDYFLIPRYSGKLIENPKVNSIDNTLNYPRGWSATMQFCAYYNDDYGIYLGTHDPKASRKNFVVKKNNSNGLRYENVIPIPDQSLSGNDWDYSGVFRLQLFKGDWYEAARIYKKWASAEAEFWPQDSPAREARQSAIGSIGAWITEWGNNLSPSLFFNLQSVLGGVPLGLSWYNWMQDKGFDEDYPYLLPEYSSMTNFVHNVQRNNDIFVVPYTNGRLFDQTLSEYPTQGKPYATKNSQGEEYTQSFNNRLFSVMCPTQTEYQDILIDQSTQLTNRIGCAGVYFDQVCASSPIECMDTTHHHTIGGGTIWRDGYNQLFEREHASMASDSNFITSEGACDFLADEVDGFLTLGWMASNMVPAFQVVYGGKVQLLTTSLGYDYSVASFYCKLAQLFVNGIQPGWFSTGITSNASSLLFAKGVSSVRYKLKDFMSFGTLMKPIEIDRSAIPIITSWWHDHIEGKYVKVELFALQYSLWKNKQENKAALVFANASMDKTINFTLNFDGNSRGLSGKLKLQKVTADSIIDIGIKDNSFSMDITMSPLDVFSYIIEPDSIETTTEKGELREFDYKLEQNYPNPFNPTTEINFSISVTGNTTLAIYNVLGQKVATLVDEELSAGSYKYQFDASNLTSGIYFYQLQSNDYSQVKKMMLLK